MSRGGSGGRVGGASGGFKAKGEARKGGGVRHVLVVRGGGEGDGENVRTNNTPAAGVRTKVPGKKASNPPPGRGSGGDRLAKSTGKREVELKNNGNIEIRVRVEEGNKQGPKKEGVKGGNHRQPKPSSSFSQQQQQQQHYRNGGGTNGYHQRGGGGKGRSHKSSPSGGPTQSKINRRLAWFYQDRKGKQRGPHVASEMLHLFSSNQLQLNSNVRPLEAICWSTLTSHLSTLEEQAGGRGSKGASKEKNERKGSKLGKPQQTSGGTGTSTAPHQAGGARGRTTVERGERQDWKTREAVAKAKELFQSAIEWRYIDPTGAMQGPFGGDSMLSWFERGYLHDKTLPMLGSAEKGAQPDPSDFRPFDELLREKQRTLHSYANGPNL